MFIASVIFMVIPNSFLLRLESFLPSSVSVMGQRRNTEYMRQRLMQASMAFDDLYRTVRDAVGLDRNDSDTAAVFDASAEKTCRMCPNAQYCWGAKYQSTLDALNSAAPVMLSRGKLLKDDLPEYFIGECKSPDDFVKAVNEELKGLMYRRQYRAKLLENQKAAFGQYADISSILSGFASDMSSAAGYEPGYESKLKKYLSSKGIPGEVAVFRDRRPAESRNIPDGGRQAEEEQGLAGRAIGSYGSTPLHQGARRRRVPHIDGGRATFRVCWNCLHKQGGKQDQRRQGSIFQN